MRIFAFTDFDARRILDPRARCSRVCKQLLRSGWRQNYSTWGNRTDVVQDLLSVSVLSTRRRQAKPAVAGNMPLTIGMYQASKQEELLYIVSSFSGLNCAQTRKNSLSHIMEQPQHLLFTVWSVLSSLADLWCPMPARLGESVAPGPGVIADLL